MIPNSAHSNLHSQLKICIPIKTALTNDSRIEKHEKTQLLTTVWPVKRKKKSSKCLVSSTSRVESVVQPKSNCISSSTSSLSSPSSSAIKRVEN